MADQSTTSTNVGEEAKTYWATNIRIISVCLVIWALLWSFGFGISAALCPAVHPSGRH